MDHMNAGEYYLRKMVKGSSNSKSYASSDINVSELITKWQELLNISDWVIECESIAEMQVTDALEGNSPGHEFVGIGINFNDKIGIIYHTRSLLEDDIIHELLHVRYPEWSEEKVNFWTEYLENGQFVRLA